MLASDAQNPEFVGARNPDDVLTVKFYMRVDQDNFKSKQEGRPIHFSIPYVRIQIPGNQLSIIDTPALAEHKQRFPRQWAAFENSQQVVMVEGTPLDQWPAISRERAEDLRAVKFFSVEQIANCSDLQLQSLGMDANALRMKARAFLVAAKDTALAQSQADDLLKKDQIIADLQDQMKRLAEMVEKATAPKQKRKYTKRAKQEAA